MFDSTLQTVPVLQYSTDVEIKQALLTSRQTFKNGYTKPLQFRRHQLEQLWRLVDENENLLYDVLFKDLRKNKDECFLGEIVHVKEEINHALLHLDDWAKDERTKPSLVNDIGTICIKRKEPKGNVLIICPWSHPVYLVLGPLIGAIAAGCTAVIKPSEVAPNTANLLSDLIPRYLDDRAFIFVNGSIPETTQLLRYKWDHIFYCGNGAVAKTVMKAASRNLTSLTLELGGKNPVIIDDNINFGVAAKRIAFGKTFSAGQTCIAPDYALVTAKSEAKFINELEKAFKGLYGEDPQASNDYARIINDRHFRRLHNLILERKSGEVVIGGQTDEGDLFIAPTVITNVDRDDKLMESEIFGPLLPIVRVSDVDDAIEYINSRGEPLTLYVFSSNKKYIKKVVDSTRSGGVLINDTLMHMTERSLPFGGLGSSGMGSYHGKSSFDTFTHVRSVMTKSLNPVTEKGNALRYAPYKRWKMAIMRVLLETEPHFRKGIISNIMHETDHST
ncbi:Aldehyde dehydrogenase [Mortierella sp. AM989]|nr:Aldehyde dehydrogenase [Mortierella sp. AM989]